MKRLLKIGPSIIAVLVALMAIGVVSADGAGGVTGPAFYVDGELYRTVSTPTDLSGTGAPARSFDVIYAIPGQMYNVAEVAPGQRGYNGGRWMVRLVEFNDSSLATTIAAHDANGSGDLDSDEEVKAALDDAGSTGATAETVVANFVCPVIKIN